MNPRHRKLALAGLSTALSIAVAVPLVQRHLAALANAGGTVRVVDTSEGLQRLLAESARPGSTGSTGSPESTGSSESTGDHSRQGRTSYPPPLERSALDAETAELFFPAISMGPRSRFDPQRYLARTPHRSRWVKWGEHPDGGFAVRTNDLGLRDDDDVRVEKAPLRILVTGDSHVEGVVPADETLSHVLESLLGDQRPPGTVEVLNAAVGGYNVYNYLGTLEGLLELHPDVFVAVLYGGNDFYHTVQMWRMFSGLGAPRKPARLDAEQRRAWAASGTVRSQETGQVQYFLANPDDVQLAVDATCSLLQEMATLCEERSVGLVVVYLPPPLASQPARHRTTREATLAALGSSPDSIEVSDRIADGVLQFLTERQIDRVDLRDRFGAEERDLYWRSDFHINTHGHRVAAEELFGVLAELEVARTALDQQGEPVGSFTMEIPDGPRPGWVPSSDAVRFIAYEERAAIAFPGKQTTSRLRIGPDERLLGARRVRIRAGSDRAFQIRVGRSGQLGDAVECAGTARRLTELALELPLAEGGADASVLTLEVTADAPVVIGRLRVDQ